MIKSVTNLFLNINLNSYSKSYYKPMFKSKRRCETKCSQHSFEITHTQNTKYNTLVSFCPKYYRFPKPPEKTYPIFNFDSYYFTSAFILGVDRRILACSHEQELTEHNKQIRQSLQKPGAILFPRPHKKHTLCSVCKQKYTNYYAHIMSVQHKSGINTNSYNQFILELQSLYQHLHVEIAPVPLTIVDIASHKQQKSTEPEQDNIVQNNIKKNTDLQKEKDKLIADQIVNTNKNLQIIPNQIAQYIISSDQDQNSRSCEIHSVQTISSKVDDSSQQSSSTDSSNQSQGSSKNANVSKISLSSNDSVEIVGVIRSNNQKSKSNTNIKNSQKKKEGAQNMQLEKKHGKNKKTKTIKKSNAQSTTQKVRMKPGPKPRSRFIDLSSSREGTDYLIKSTKMKYQPHPVNRPAQILIQKSQINDPMLQSAMSNILDSIVETINPNKKLNLSLLPQPCKQNNMEVRFGLQQQQSKQEKSLSHIFNNEKIVKSTQKVSLVLPKNNSYNQRQLEKQNQYHIKQLQLNQHHLDSLLEEKPKKINSSSQNLSIYKNPQKSKIYQNLNEMDQLNLKRPITQQYQNLYKTTKFGTKYIINNDMQAIPVRKQPFSTSKDDEIVEVPVCNTKKQLDLQFIKKYQQRQIHSKQKNNYIKISANSHQKHQNEGRKQLFNNKKYRDNQKSEQHRHLKHISSHHIQSNSLLFPLLMTKVRISPLRISSILRLTNPNQNNQQKTQKYAQ